MNNFDIIIPAILSDFKILQNHLNYLLEYLDAKSIIIIGNDELENYINSKKFNVRFINENTILSYKTVSEYISKIDDKSKSRTGWYLQQFLKMSYAFICENKYYFIWDCDSIPTKKVSMFDKNTPVFDMKNEYHKPYFDTIHNIMPDLGKLTDQSYISEHMIINVQYMKDLITSIEANTEIEGNTYWQKILNSINKSELKYSGFSEFETYGTYVDFFYPNQYKKRNWKSSRIMGIFYKNGNISKKDLKYFSRDFDALSFEKCNKFNRLKSILIHSKILRIMYNPSRLLEKLMQF